MKNIFLDGVEYAPVEKAEKLFDLNLGGHGWISQGEYGKYSISSIQFTKNQQYSVDFMEAMQVIFELKACDGVVAINDGEQWGINNKGKSELRYADEFKPTRIFPFFNTQVNCRLAIDKIGKDRIKKAMETWHKV